jgi:hypothetical protein
MKSDVLTFSISSSLLIIAFAVAFYLFVFLPQERRNDIYRKEEVKTNNRVEEAKINEQCQTEAKTEAIKMAKAVRVKINELIDKGLASYALETNPKLKKYFDAGIEGKAYLREDYDYLYEQCKERNGLD